MWIFQKYSVQQILSLQKGWCNKAVVKVLDLSHILSNWKHFMSCHLQKEQVVWTVSLRPWQQKLTIYTNEVLSGSYYAENKRDFHKKDCFVLKLHLETQLNIQLFCSFSKVHQQKTLLYAVNKPKCSTVLLPVFMWCWVDFVSQSQLFSLAGG